MPNIIDLKNEIAEIEIMVEDLLDRKAELEDQLKEAEEKENEG